MKMRSRAYIMLEVAVGGAMIAVVIMGVLTALADGRTRNAYAGRDVIASQLVLAKLEEYRTMTRANAKAACTALRCRTNRAATHAPARGSTAATRCPACSRPFLSPP